MTDVLELAGGLKGIGSGSTDGFCGAAFTSTAIGSHVGWGRCFIVTDRSSYDEHLPITQRRGDGFNDRAPDRRLGAWVCYAQDWRFRVSPSKIEVGKTYCNRGKGRTRRTVLEISDQLKAPWFSSNERPNDPVVLYEQDGVQGTLYLSSFAAWCGREVGSA